MGPIKVLTEQDYQKIASRLLDETDQENFIEQCEKEYLSANRNFYTHLEKAVKGLYYTKEEYERMSDFMALVPPPDNAKTEKTLTLVRAYAAKSATHTFDISRFQFELKNNRVEVTQEPGKVVHYVCCEQTMQYLKGLIPYAPNEKEFSVFENVFSEQHKLKQWGTVSQFVEAPEKVEGFFQVVQETLNLLFRHELKEYFFQCLEMDINLPVVKEITGRLKLPILTFAERLEALKQQALNPSEMEAEETGPAETNPEFTTARQVLAIHFLLEYCKVQGVDKTQIARFIEFLTGKNYDNIYKRVKSPYSTKKGNFRKEDFQYIRPYFEKLGLAQIVKMIDNELDVTND